MLSHATWTFFFTLRRPLLGFGFRQVQNAVHDVGRTDLGVEVEVAVDVRRRAHVAVTEPFLNLFHRYAVGEQ